MTLVHLHHPGSEKVAITATFVIRLLAFEDLGDARPVEADHGRYPPEAEAFIVQFTDSVAERLLIGPDFAGRS